MDTAKEDDGKVFIQIARNGEVTFFEGLISRKEARANLAGAGTSDKPARPEMPGTLRNYLDLHRHAGVRERLVSHHGLALRLAVAQIIAGSPLWSVQAAAQKATKDTTRESLATNKAETRFAEERTAIADLLGLDIENSETIVPRKQDWGASLDLSAIFARLKTLSDDQVLCILSFLTAECLPEDAELVDALGTEMKSRSWMTGNRMTRSSIFAATRRRSMPWSPRSQAGTLPPRISPPRRKPRRPLSRPALTAHGLRKRPSGNRAI